jgi:glutaredoxin 2
MWGQSLIWLSLITIWASSVPSYGAVKSKPVTSTAAKMQRSSEVVNCQSLILQLEAMQGAQKSLLQSMVRKNDTVADSFADYADQFEMKGHRFSKLDLFSLRNTSDSFRKHKERENQLIEKFNHSSSELISKVSICLAGTDHSLRASEVR